MTKFKALAGVVVLLGVPAAFGALMTAAAYSFAVEHVHYVSAEFVQGVARAVVHDHDHSTAGIIAVAGACGMAWIVLSSLGVLAGGAMIAYRHKEW